MRKIWLSLVAMAVALVVPGFATAQYAQNQAASSAHLVAGTYIAQAYANYTGCELLSGNASTGSQSVVVYCQPGQGGVALRDGTILPLTTVFNTSTPIEIADNNAEVETPSAVTIGSCPAGNVGVGGSANCATVTATWSNTHGASAQVVSGDAGMEEALIDAQNHGGGPVSWYIDCGKTVLSTSSATNTLACMIPNNYVTGGASVFVNTTITTATSYSVGISSHTTDFINGCTALTATNTAAGCNKAPTLEVANTSFALTAVIITMQAAVGAGAMHLAVWGTTQMQSGQ